jgi:hypothetical protein
MAQRRGGIIQLQIDGEIFQARGNFSYNLGLPMREAIVGADGVHGFKETPQVPFVEGEITDSENLDVAALATMQDVLVTLELANGKTISLAEAWFAGEGTGNSEEGNIGFRFEAAQQGQEIS